MGATLGTLTNGRFILGMGAGWRKKEYKAYGYTFPPISVRIRQLDEGLSIIKKMWSEDKTTFKGKYHKV
jgi:alkanesulfonate monooxygenase SsuD/methylene tetrahydromethanopterin reductase-like flavin-dependent oxidoreductase (luciferase family)